MATISFYDSPSYVTTIETPTIFLAGPILGSWDWQEKAKEYLKEICDNDISGLHIQVCNPRRPEFKSLSDFDDSTFFDQVDWEHHHLDIAKQPKGVTLFWLANKSIVIPNRNYCLTTLFELGEVIGISDNKPINLSIGIEPGFTNEKYIKYTITRKAPKATVSNDLYDTCLNAFITIKGLS